jgi:aspartate carbamoyltransferase catalytic subunit
LLLSATQLDRARIDHLLAAASDAGRLKGKHRDAVVGLAFYEPSLRTRLGFQVAAARLGASTATVTEEKQSKSMWAPERVEDAVRSIGSWFDVVCLRHADEGAFDRAVRTSSTPLINCGDGAREHPTQALVDLRAINAMFGRVDGLRIVIVGDLAAMRTAHSLALTLAQFENLTIKLSAPQGLGLTPATVEVLRRAGHAVEETTALELDEADVVYVAGLPAQTAIGTLSHEDQARYRITAERAARMPEGGRVLCPLPRVDEIDPAVDRLPQAGYFTQSALALEMRMAILDEALCDSERR